jgi:hypothetical protein
LVNITPTDERRLEMGKINTYAKKAVDYLKNATRNGKKAPCVKPLYDALESVLPADLSVISIRGTFYNGGSLLSEIRKRDDNAGNVSFSYGDELNAKLRPGDLVMKMMPVAKNDPRIAQHRKAGDLPILVDAAGAATPYIAGTRVPDGSKIYLVVHYLTAGNANGDAATVIHSSVKKPLHEDNVPEYIKREGLDNHSKYGFLVISPSAFIVPGALAQR